MSIFFVDINPKVTSVWWLNQWVYLDPRTPLPLCCLLHVVAKRLPALAFGATLYRLWSTSLYLVSIAQGTVFAYDIFVSMVDSSGLLRMDQLYVWNSSIRKKDFTTKFILRLNSMRIIDPF